MDETINRKIPIHCVYTKMLKIEDFKPYPQNVAKHPSKQIKTLAENIKQLGWRHPITISNQSGYIVYGHARLEAAKLLGVKEIPTEYQDFKSVEEERTSRLADNRIAELVVTDVDKLKLEIIDIKASGNRLDTIGYSETELNRIIKIDEDKAINNLNEIEKNKIAEKWKVKLGQLWKLGEHYLLCGDSCKKENADRLLSIGSPTLMVTDPPYGINYDQSWILKVKSTKVNNGDGDRFSLSNALGDNNADWSNAYKLFNGNVAYIWSPNKINQKMTFIVSIYDSGFSIRSEIIWNKTRGSLSRCQYKPTHETCFYSVRQGLPSDTNYNTDKTCPYDDDYSPCLYCIKDGTTSNWNGDCKERSVWSFNSLRQNDDKTGHSNQKPLECYVRPILNSSKVGDYVYDPFVGSGTCIISCERTKRKCLAIELCEDYVALCLERYEKGTKVTPTLV